MYLHSRVLLLLSILAALIPTALFAQSAYTCDCAADTLNCSDFASPADAQACFWSCGAQGVGDIHQLDLDMNAVACDVIAQPAAPSTPEPVYIEPAPTLEPIYVMPTVVPAYEVCSCGGDYYDCDTFSGPSHAQGCYDYCTGLGSGDVHLMDPDGDGLACLVSGAASTVPMSTALTPMPTPYVPPTAVYVAPISTATPLPYMPPTAAPIYIAPTVVSTVYIPPTATPYYVAPVPTIIPTVYMPPTVAPAYVAPTPTYMVPTAVPTVYVPPTMVPMSIVPTATSVPYIPGLDVYGKVVAPDVCACDADHYNCDSFNSREDAVACASHCSNLGYGDIHRLDQGGAKNVMCEAEFDTYIDFDAVAVSNTVCDCSYDRYNCTDGSFQTQEEAQSCFNYCSSLGLGDIHRIDGNDKDFMACESLP